MQVMSPGGVRDGRVFAATLRMILDGTRSLKRGYCARLGLRSHTATLVIEAA